MTALLETRGLTVRYGRVQALTDVSLEVGAGQLVGLIGPNGAGKTTLIDAVTGFTASEGHVILDGGRIDALSPAERVAAGLARTWQSAELFEDLTVSENLAVAADRRGAWQIAAETLTGRSTEPREVAEALSLLNIGHLAGVGADALTQGQRKLVGVARALASGPKVVCLDEPAAGLDTVESRLLGRHLRSVVDSGMGMLLIDHDMGLVLAVCDEVVVVEFGCEIARGSPDVVRRDPRVIEAYLGANSHVEVEGVSR
jgi:branched-chain amino acid transport system ATP-binding protein